MGAKCFHSEENSEIEVPYPKFTYISTEAGLSVKFTSPKTIQAKSIRLDLHNRIPIDALVCKIYCDYYFIVGGLNLASYTHSNHSYELRFNAKEADPISPQRSNRNSKRIDFVNEENIIDRIDSEEFEDRPNQIREKALCPFAPYGGTLYLHGSQIYLVGSSYDATPVHQIEIDNERTPEPFRLHEYQPITLNKYIRPAPFVRYSLTRNWWQEIKLRKGAEKKKNFESEESPKIEGNEGTEKIDEENAEKNWEQDENYSGTLPWDLLLPGTCKVDTKIFLFSGFIFKTDEETSTEKNENIITFDLDTGKIGMMKVKFGDGPFTELKCARVSKKRIFILGGFTENKIYNRDIFVYTIDEKVEMDSAKLDQDKMFCDHNPPIGKYKFAVFFGYPDVFLIRDKSNRREYYNISARATQ